MEDDDLALALALQAEYDREIASPVEEDDKCVSGGAPFQPRPTPSLQPKSIVDPAWELMDPNPDIRTLFLEFNTRYFWGKLSMVEVKWSPRMTICAGLCCYESRSGFCSVRLSKPLLGLRPRKDLVETLLHEMIHALLFVTNNNKDHNGHGPEFCKHMNRINKETGTNITIYHSFHDEVNELRKHWWRCQGPCRTRPPYYGFVRRSINRAPSPRDTWWMRHQNSCGGTYIKVKEPENYGVKKKQEKIPLKDKASTPDILSFLSQTNKTGTAAKINTGNRDSGQRLGGESSSDQSSRGIPAFSRLLATVTNHGSQNKLPHGNVSPSHNNMQPKTTWANLHSPTKRKRWLLENEGQLGKSRNGVRTIPDMLAKMVRNGTKSVNAGAEAFKITQPVTKFHSKGRLCFTDSEEESIGTLSGKENEPVQDKKIRKLGHNNGQIHTDGKFNSPLSKIDQIKSTKIYIPEQKNGASVLTSTQKTFNNPLSNKSNPFFKGLPTLDSDSDEDCTLTQIMNKSAAPVHSNNLYHSSSNFNGNAECEDEILPKYDFSNEFQKGRDDWDENQDEKKCDVNENMNLGRSSKRLPSFSESDEDCALSDLGKDVLLPRKNPNKRFKPHQAFSGVEDLPEFDVHNGVKDRQGTEQILQSKNTSLTNSSIKHIPTIEKTSCPICSFEVALNSINSHIDDCLSLKAIRESEFE